MANCTPWFLVSDCVLWIATCSYYFHWRIIVIIMFSKYMHVPQAIPTCTLSTMASTSQAPAGMALGDPHSSVLQSWNLFKNVWALSVLMWYVSNVLIVINESQIACDSPCCFRFCHSLKPNLTKKLWEEEPILGGKQLPSFGQWYWTSIWRASRSSSSAWLAASGSQAFTSWAQLRSNLCPTTATPRTTGLFCQDA